MTLAPLLDHVAEPPVPLTPLIGREQDVALVIDLLHRAEEEAQFHSVVCWDRLAETTAEYVKKGDPLYVEGRLQYRSFQDEEGWERGICEVVADDVRFLGRRGIGNRGEPEV